MNEDSLSGLLVILVLLLLHAMVRGAFAAVSSAHLSQFREMSETGNLRARQLESLLSNRDLVTTHYLLVVLLKFGIAAVAVLNVAQPIIDAGTLLSPITVYSLTLLLAAVATVVLGDTVPEAVGTTYTDSLALTATGLLNTLVRLLSPLTLVVRYLHKLFSALTRSSDVVQTITEEQIITLIETGHTEGTIEEEQKDMLYSVLQLDQTHVSEMMVPRIDITAISLSQTLADAGRLFVSSGFSRLPVYSENLDTIHGLLYAKDLLAQWYNGTTHDSIEELMRPATFVPETKRADQLLAEMKAQNIHMAIVVDEYGGTAGLVTIEDIIEEIIGDIRDEYDLNEEADYIRLGDNEYSVDAGMDLDDFNQLLDVHLPTVDSDTLGGYIYTYFGRVPGVGDEIDEDLLHLRVMSVEGHRIRKVHVLRRYPDTIGDDKTPDADDPAAADTRADTAQTATKNE